MDDVRTLLTERYDWLCFYHLHFCMDVSVIMFILGNGRIYFMFILCNGLIYFIYRVLGVKGYFYVKYSSVAMLILIP